MVEVDKDSVAVTYYTNEMKVVAKRKLAEIKAAISFISARAAPPTFTNMNSLCRLPTETPVGNRYTRLMLAHVPPSLPSRTPLPRTRLSVSRTLRPLWRLVKRRQLPART